MTGPVRLVLSDHWSRWWSVPTPLADPCLVQRCRFHATCVLMLARRAEPRHRRVARRSATSIYAQPKLVRRRRCCARVCVHMRIGNGQCRGQTQGQMESVRRFVCIMRQWWRINEHFSRLEVPSSAETSNHVDRRALSGRCELCVVQTVR